MRLNFKFRVAKITRGRKNLLNKKNTETNEHTKPYLAVKVETVISKIVVLTQLQIINNFDMSK